MHLKYYNKSVSFKRLYKLLLTRHLSPTATEYYSLLVENAEEEYFKNRTERHKYEGVLLIWSVSLVFKDNKIRLENICGLYV